MRSLAGVENVGRAVEGERLFESGDAEVARHGVGQSPRQDLARVPVHDRQQMPESFFEGHVGDVRRPHLIRSIDHDVAQPVGVDRMSPVGQRRLGLGRQASDPHESHQALDPLTIDRNARAPQDPHHHARPVLGVGEVEPVNHCHEARFSSLSTWARSR